MASTGTVRTELPVEEEFDLLEKSSFVEAHFWEKLGQLGKGFRFVADLLALFAYMMDREVHWAKKTLVVAALLYFIIPVDSIPDVAPVVGYLDDIGVVTAAARFLGNQLKAYYF